MQGKIKTLEMLQQITADIKSTGKKIVHCHGVFDLLHIGHIKHFEEARSFGDALVVTITPDEFVNKGPNHPAFTTELALNRWQLWNPWITWPPTNGPPLLKQ